MLKKSFCLLRLYCHNKCYHMYNLTPLFKSSNASIKFLWVFFLMLSNNKKNINKIFMSKYVSSFSFLIVFFKSLSFSYTHASFKSWNKFYLLNSLACFFASLRRVSFSNNFLNFFYCNFKRLFCVFSFLLTPNFIFKKADLVYFNKVKSRHKLNSLAISNNLFFYYGFSRVKHFFYNFSFLKYYIDSFCFTKYFLLLSVYFFLFNSLFYGNLSLFFIFKNQILFATQWWETPKKFFVSVSSISKRFDNSYSQNAAFFFWSSVSFLRYFSFAKHLRLSLNIKFVMIRHLRRVLILLNVEQILFIFKTYVTNLNVLYFTSNLPINEIFISPSDNSVIFDILVKTSNDESFYQFMDKYKNYVQDLLNINVLLNFLKKWDLLLNNFKGCLRHVKFQKSDKLGERTFLRYSFSCDLLFFFRKKFLVLKQKKAQSISKRRVKRIIKVAKRRFWIF